MVDDHANPFAIHDIESTNSLESLVALLEGLEDLICVARAFPASLLVQIARMLQEVDRPLDEGVPIGRIFCDPPLVQYSFGL